MICPCCDEDIGEYRDKMLLEFCKKYRSITDIAKHLDIAIPNAGRRVNKLFEKGRIMIKNEGDGRKKLVMAKEAVFI